MPGLFQLNDGSRTPGHAYNSFPSPCAAARPKQQEVDVMKKITRLAVPGVALAALLLVAAPTKAKAGVGFGVYVGPPAYTYPADPYAYSYNPYAYQYPYAGSYPYNYSNPYYGYPGPTYAAPYYGGGGGDHERHEWREHQEQEYREHGFRGRGGEDHGRR
jgi:hypothetical protein